ncbi:glycoside hydrolase domain-containing protein [Glycomyces tritici]|uniref:DUF1906 domain-containing protein n=1 Tax=Glycomyces tritici TaxID=2665176 RepID=A0ABT7YQ06_9ACTN|nr:glycoside hydrolase domain-containing protein [Glycomyces tritici]MDN3240683.1 DUF1906 domain-containing protein [Glycomyces tritici]
MDIKVQEAQIWVNETFADVPGYIRCETDGEVGQGTMRSLIMGLQHVLFTSAENPAQVSGVFGPTTLSLLAGWGEIGKSTTSELLCNIARHGLWCHGYTGGWVDGEIDDAAVEGIRAIREDMGMLIADYISPKIFKGILTTDPYKFNEERGNENVRAAQRFLNYYYSDIPAYSMSPTDGLLSRGYQQALMMGVQKEIGIASAQITGIFGPGTQAGLKTSKFKLSQNAVESQVAALYVAACLMNEGEFDGTRYSVQWRRNYSSEVVEFTAAFQKFSALQNTTGNTDFDTWAQLLVSSGNPDRTYRRIACDCISEITPSRAAALSSAGYRTVGRYLDEDLERIPEDQWRYKWIQDGELESIFAAGLNCFPISQYWGGELGEFTYANGVHEAGKAHDRAVEYGFEAGTCIYFAVDYDALDSEMSYIIDYFRGVRDALQSKGGRYIAGVYGSRNVCIRVSAAGLAKWSFVSGMSWGFSGNQGFPLPPNWSFNQIKEANFVVNSSDSFGLDSNISRIGADFGVDHVQNHTSREAFLDRLDTIYDAIYRGGWVADFDPDSTGNGGQAWNADQLAHFFLKHPQFTDALSGDPWATDVRNAYPNLDVAGWMEHALSYLGSGRYMSVTVFEDLDISTAKMFSVTSRLTVMRTTPITGWNEPMISPRRGALGDLARLYNQWRNNRSAYPSGADFCEAYMGRLGVPSFLTVENFMETAYGELMSHFSMPTMEKRVTHNDALRAAWEYSLTDAIDLCNGEVTSTEAWENNVLAALKELSQIDDDATNVHDLWRKELLLEVGSAPGQIDMLPHQLPSGELFEFVSGYVNRRIYMANGEF